MNFYDSFKDLKIQKFAKFLNNSRLNLKNLSLFSTFYFWESLISKSEFDKNFTKLFYRPYQLFFTNMSINLHFLIMECCRYLVFWLNDYMELFITVPAYSWLFIFANTEIYVQYYKTHWKIVKTTFNKFFRCMTHLGVNCMKFLFTFIFM